MAVSIIKVTPTSVTAIGDDGKNKAANLFDQDLTNRWSYKGKFAYNLVKLDRPYVLNNLVFYWYMKKGENRKYNFGIYLSEQDITIPADFVSAKNDVQKLYDDASTIKPLTNDGKTITNVPMSG